MSEFRSECKCPDCADIVALNGPGSDLTTLGRFSRWLAYKLLPTAQELALFPSIAHDMDYHNGPRPGKVRDEERKLADDRYLEGCLDKVKNPPSDIKGRWKIRMFPGTFKKIFEAHYFLLRELGDDYYPHTHCTIRKQNGTD